jgi:hypothetical protein
MVSLISICRIHAAMMLGTGHTKKIITLGFDISLPSFPSMRLLQRQSLCAT